tara:strand:+ start:9878 stop:11170 length:1293 start_codon:yes stop_codon:yes gene_type:complete
LNKESKNFEFKAIDDEKGSVEAVFSVFNKLDTDGDVVLPSAIKSGFKDDQVPMVFAHKWDQPIGKGVITSDDEKATFRGNFFMDTEAGKEAYHLAKAMADLQEWSFGFRINDAEVKEYKSEDGDEISARFLKDLTVYEVSPVLVGANRETYTLDIKSGEEAVYESSNLDEEKAANPEDVFDNPAEAMERSKKLSCEIGVHTHKLENGKEVFMPCKTHEEYDEATGNSDKPKEKSLEEEVIENDSSQDSESDTGVQGLRFSDEVKDVLAALENLIVRATSIGELRKGEGRKLSEKATSALRAVQEDLNDAWAEIDQLIEDVSIEPESNIDDEKEEESSETETAEAEEIVSEVETPAEEIAEEVEEEESSEESEVVEEEASEESSEDEPEIAEAEAPVEEVQEAQEVMEDDSELFAETQQLLADAAVAELDE